ncbi:MAG: sulfite oxidase-like oxidoreductase [Anaerolineae bacterium]|nr:sulfite oxidase-like oxidoreductase [Anaerolineae bacterium]
MFNSIMRRQEEEKRMLEEKRLPPGQALTQKFPVLHYGPVPGFNPVTWNFRAWGRVEKPLSLTWDEFNQLPRTRVKMDLHCVTRWSKFDTLWEGVSVRTLLEAGLVKLLPDARFILQHAEYGYTTNIPLEVALSENFLMATHFDGEVISPDHGYPLRGVVGAIPGHKSSADVYLWKGAKWLRGLEFLSQDKAGFWEQAGYSNTADIWKEERFA